MRSWREHLRIFLMIMMTKLLLAFWHTHTLIITCVKESEREREIGRHYSKLKLVLLMRSVGTTSSIVWSLFTSLSLSFVHIFLCLYLPPSYAENIDYNLLLNLCLLACLLEKTSRVGKQKYKWSGVAVLVLVLLASLGNKSHSLYLHPFSPQIGLRVV